MDIDNINTFIFDFGGVLVDWNPHYLYDAYFGSREKADWFLANICPLTWNAQMDAGKPFADAIAEKVAEFPEWEREIRMYHSEWLQMMGNQIPGMQGVLECLRGNGYKLYGLTNWAAETFALVRHKYPIFDLLDAIVVSGEEKVAKPDPQIFRILLDRYAVEPAHTVFVDDNLSNIEAAQTLGIQTVLFQSTTQLQNELGLLL